MAQVPSGAVALEHKTHASCIGDMSISLINPFVNLINTYKAPLREDASNKKYFKMLYSAEIMYHFYFDSSPNFL